MEVRNVEKSESKWRFLHSRTPNHRYSAPSSSTTPACTTAQPSDNDPFSCKDLTIPSTKSFIEEILSEGISKWKELDSRKIPPKKRPKFGESVNRSKIVLPLGFDYTCSSSSPLPPGTEDDDKVISLKDPTKHDDYAMELWKLFQTIPTESQCIVRNRIRGMSDLSSEINTAIRDYTRADCHALSRLRLRNMHHFPFPEAGSRIRVECWKRELKRGSSPDDHRMEAEFSCFEDVTLLDVHEWIVSQYFSCKDCRAVEEEGLFCIENMFYVNGDAATDAALNILYWLDDENIISDDANVTYPRREYLALPTPPSRPIQSMSDARLQSLNFRLGVRYVNIFRADIETMVFFTDIRTCLSPSSSSHSTCTIIDKPSRTYTNTTCEGCNHAVAAVVCCNNSLVNGGAPTFLCSLCYWKFCYDSKGCLIHDNFQVYDILELEEQKVGKVTMDTND